MEECRSSMGDFRFFLCPPNVASAADVARRHPDHGLLHIVKHRIVIVLPAPRRKIVALHSEVRYLRFALIHVRDNLLKWGCRVDLTELTKFFGETGVTLPGKSPALPSGDKPVTPAPANRAVTLRLFETP